MINCTENLLSQFSFCVMAEKTIENELTNCTICLDTYTDPKILQCFHVYCQKCLVKLVMRDQQGQLSLSCPICRQVTPVPASGTAGLQSAFHINRLLEILDLHKKAKGEAASAERVDSKAESLPSALCCSEHDGREVELFCETCGELICYKCAIKGGKHHSHDHKDIDESFEKFKEEVTPSLEPLEKKMTALTNRGIGVAVVGEKVFSVLETTTFKGEPCSEASVSRAFQVELVSEITGGKVFGSVEHSMEQRGQGQYVISYQPTVKGRHQLHIKADGQHIRGSPFRVTVTLPVENLSSPIQALRELDGPCGVAVNGKGEVVVAECDIHRISVHSSCGVKLRSVGRKGCAEAQFKTPTDVAVDGEGNILVLDWGNHRIQKFTADGDFLGAVGSNGSGPLQFDSPHGITYSASNNKVYITDLSNHRVQVLTPGLTFIGMFGKQGSGKGQFSYPSGVATDSTGRVYVADNGNYRIQVFTAEGKFLRRFGRKGASTGELSRPWGVGVDASGLVYVSEFGNHRVSVFTSEGRFVTAFGSKGTGPGQFNSPRGLAVNDSGVVYVCDSGNNSIKLF